MAPKAPSGVRSTGNRRIFKVQKFHHDEIQVTEAFTAEIQAAVDTYRKSSPKRITRLIRANLYIRFGEESWPVYHALPEQLLLSLGIRGIRVDATTGCIPAHRRSDQTPDPSDECRRLSLYARTDF